MKPLDETNPENPDTATTAQTGTEPVSKLTWRQRRAARKAARQAQRKAKASAEETDLHKIFAPPPTEVSKGEEPVQNTDSTANTTDLPTADLGGLPAAEEPGVTPGENSPTQAVNTTASLPLMRVLLVGDFPAPTEEVDPQALVHMRKIHRAVYQPDSTPLHILRGVDLKIMPGEHLAIVGRSGTGKSTLLNLLGLLDTPSGGEYALMGQDALRLSEQKRSQLRGKSVGFVFQQFNLFEARTAQENVEVPLLYTFGKDFWMRSIIAEEMLHRVGLGKRLHSRPGQLSGGEQQRVAIARALVRKPNLILADEPTGALDPNTGLEVMELLEDVAEENNSALVVITHDPKVAARSERIYHLYDGILHTEPPREETK